MAALVWIGAALAVAGLAGVLWCLVEARRIRAAGLEGEAAKTALRRLIAVNMAAVGGAFLGLAVLAAGVILG